MTKTVLHTLTISLAFAISTALLAQEPGGTMPEQNAPAASAPAQTGPVYTPKYHGDPARSDSEAKALGYMRVVMRAQMLYNKKNAHYATALLQLVHTGTFTQRMVPTDREDYTVGFKSKKDSYILTMTPKAMDAQHRSFYAEDDGKIHADETKPADGDSPVIETHRW
ncbi:MAG TPA: hypothetical protein VMH04_01265 [Candidatus Solibacter sp.]|nr:hypothetical protein [Candidatus Solibacter sp.]